LNLPSHAFLLPSEAELLKELKSIVEAWLDVNNARAARTSLGPLVDARITNAKALADLINTTCKTSPMAGSELLFFHQLLTELQKWEQANAIIETSTDAVQVDPQPTAANVVAATHTSLAPASPQMEAPNENENS
jgi:hypothetical protein